jgi:hypothetical protein
MAKGKEKKLIRLNLFLLSGELTLLLLRNFFVRAFVVSEGVGEAKSEKSARKVVKQLFSISERASNSNCRVTIN